MAKKKIPHARIIIELISGGALIKATNELNNAGVISWFTSIIGLLGIVLIVFALIDFFENRKNNNK